MSIAALICAVIAGPASAQHAGHGSASPYAGQQSRAIKSLSEEDIAELRRGGGWGLAKAAELNGMPGPAHLLELADQIALDAEQRTAIRAGYESMRDAAIAEGERLIALERELDAHFRQRTITDAELRRLLDAIAASLGRLRYIHLSTHLSTPSLLTEHQIARYKALRGYGTNPCDQVPAGHDPALWRKHNDCR
ncbi:MAG: hypothetical protein JSW68_00155 [Burkholderiales bacterium]|nr:MAG: hypothetical protein JSW68_00155 [Burkholderiales bacterium]